MANPSTRSGPATYADYLAWPGDERWEILDGEPRAMSPAPGRVHQRLLVELGRQVANQLGRGPCEVYLAPFDVRLPRGDEPDAAIETVVQPDLAVVCDAAKLDDAGCRGAPEWILEVLSASTATHDHLVKRALYERSGVAEYWLVHPRDRLVWIYRLKDGRYGEAELLPLSGCHEVAAVPGLWIDWDEAVTRLPDAE